MRRLNSRNKRLFLSCVVWAGGAALKQSYLLFRLITAMSLPLGVIWLNAVLVMGSPVIEFLAASGLSAVLFVGLVWLRGVDSRGLIDMFILNLGVDHES